MAWQTIGTRNLTNPSNTVVGYVYLQYDNATAGANWNVRLITGARSGYSFNVRFDNVTVAGINQGTKTGVTQNNVVVWSGSLAGNQTVNGSWSCPWDGGTRSYTISGTLPAKGTAPTGGFVTYNSSTWNSVTFTTGVSSWVVSSGSNHAALFTGDTNGAMDTIDVWGSVARYEYFWNNSSDLSHQFVGRDNNYDAVTKTPLAVKGLLHYKLGFYVFNSVGDSYYMDPELHYLPPAPGQVTYTDPGGSGAKTYPVTYTGVVANNHTTYDSAYLTRTVRYKIDSGNWVTVDNDTVAAIDFVTSFNVSVPAGSTATIEAYMEYHGERSEVTTVYISNSNTAAKLYGSVGGTSVQLGPVYASVSGQTKKLVKIYASVGGVTKKVYEDV